MFCLYNITIGSVYKRGWMSCPDEWRDDSIAEDFEVFKEIRAQSMKVLEVARSHNVVTSSLESEVTVQVHQELQHLINHHFSSDGYTLADFLIVSSASITTNDITDSMNFTQSHKVRHKDTVYPITVGVVKANGCKCPRCWRYLSTDEDRLCSRCDIIMKQLL